MALTTAAFPGAFITSTSRPLFSHSRPLLHARHVYEYACLPWKRDSPIWTLACCMLSKHDKTDANMGT